MMATPDNISFDNYKHDMDELGDRASGIIRQQKAEIDNLHCLVAALIEGAGGSVEVPDHLIANLNSVEMVMEYDPANACRRYSIKRKATAT